MARSDFVAIVTLLGTQAAVLSWSAFVDPTETTPAVQCSNHQANNGLSILSPLHLATLQRDGIVVLQCGLSPADVAFARADAATHMKGMQMDLDITDVRTDLKTWIQNPRLNTSVPPSAGARLQQFCRRVKAIDDWATGNADTEVTDTTLKDGSGLQPCVSLLRGLAAELDASPEYTRTHGHSSPVELQLSCYAHDAFYRPHRDSPTLGTSSSFAALGLKSWLQVRHYRKRAVTAILYLNMLGWDVEKDGGGLNVYLETDDDDETGKSAQSTLSVAPSGGTLVLFDSEKMLHEVTPTTCERFALTCWICGERGEVHGS